MSSVGQRKRRSERQRHQGFTSPRVLDSSPTAWGPSPMASPSGPEVFSRLTPPTPTPIFDTLWRFAAERQAIFFRRFRGQPPPWTNDPILITYKFTNAYRASDRVSQFLIRNVIYQRGYSPADVVFRTLLFKLFNRVETWRLLVHAFGEVSLRTYRLEAYDDVLSSTARAGSRIYSGAYIMPTGLRLCGDAHKPTGHLRLLDRMMSENLPYDVSEATSLAEVFALLRLYPSIGDFLAYQFATVWWSRRRDFAQTVRSPSSEPRSPPGCRSISATRTVRGSARDQREHQWPAAPVSAEGGPTSPAIPRRS